MKFFIEVYLHSDKSRQGDSSEENEAINLKVSIMKVDKVKKALWGVSRGNEGRKWINHRPKQRCRQFHSKKANIDIHVQEACKIKEFIGRGRKLSFHQYTKR